MARSKCPGCGLVLAEQEGPTHPYMHCSAACWQVYGRVLAREYGNPDLLVTHRLTVDAYAVQHPGGADRKSIQSVGLHLARLHLTLDRQLRPEQVNKVAIRLGARKAGFVWLDPTGEPRGTDGS